MAFRSLLLYFLFHATFCALAAEPIDELTVSVDESPADSARRQAGKCGIYVRLSRSERDKNAEYVLSHPLVDALLIDCYWSEIEREPGQFDFGPIDRTIELCKRYKKGLVLEVLTYNNDEKSPAPEWVYGLGVKRITFNDLTRDNRPREIVTPKVWESAWTEALAKLVKRLGERYQHEQTIWYVAPAFGYGGSLGVFPARESAGLQAFKKEGWTFEIWKDLCNKVTGMYQTAFPETPLLMVLPRHARYDFGTNPAIDICAALVRHNVSLLAFGLEADLEKHKKNNGFTLLEKFVHNAEHGAIRLGMADDNPLWLPTDRRRDNLADRDEEGAKRLVEHAFGGTNGLPKTDITILCLSYSDIDSTHPKSKTPNKVLFDILQKAHDRLRDDDKAFSGGKQ
jgi:hypothetical protein